MDGVYYDGKGNLLGIEQDESEFDENEARVVINVLLHAGEIYKERLEQDKYAKPGDTNADGKEIEQDGDVTWD